MSSDGFRTDLGSAMLCLEPDCSTVFDGATSRACPSCGGTAYSLAVWLNRGARQARVTAARYAQQPTMRPPSHAQAATLWSVRRPPVKRSVA
jgi:Zn-finger nucleic acid-binding protein